MLKRTKKTTVAHYSLVNMPSSTPANTIGGHSLSPSNESRFVPRSSSPKSASEKSDANAPPALINDDKSLIVGATICFTPEQSPRNTPLKDTAAKNKHPAPLDLTPLDLVGAPSTNATDEYIGSIVDGSKVSSSNVIFTSSSLDGKSTTEYEVLDKSLEIEDLNLVEEEDINEGNRVVDKEECIDISAVLDNLSPTSSLPSIGSRDGEEEKEVAEGEDAKEVPKQSDDGASTNVSSSSLKVDNRSLAPFNNLHKYWEGQSITNMSKNVMERILWKEAAPDPVGTHVMDGNTSLGDVHPTPAKATLRKGGGKTNAMFHGVGNLVLTYIASFAIMIQLLARRCASSTLNAATHCADAVRGSLFFEKSLLVFATISRLCNPILTVMKRAMAGLQSVIDGKSQAMDPEASDEPKTGNKPNATPFKSTGQDPTPATPFQTKSKLFSDETIPEGASKLDMKKDKKNEPKDTTPDQPPLDVKEMERLKKINSWTRHIFATLRMIKSATVQFVSSFSGQLFISFIIAFVVMVELRMFQRFNLAKKVVAWETLVCAETGNATFDSIPMWEFLLSPTYGGTSSKPNEYGALIYIGMSFLSSLIFALYTKKMSYKSGYWDETEHHLFLKAYAKHGKDWEAVAKCVPTRTFKQVQSHGYYWLSVRSPDKSHPFSPKSIKVKKVKMEGIISPTSGEMTSPVRRVKVLHSPLTGPVKRAKMRLLDKGGQDTSEE